MSKIPLLFSDVSFGTREFGFIPILPGEDPDDADRRYEKHLQDQGVSARVDRMGNVVLERKMKTMKITESKLRQIIREEMEQLYLPGMEPDGVGVEPGMDQLGEELMDSRVADLSLEDLDLPAKLQHPRGGYVYVSSRDDYSGRTFQRWQRAWLDVDSNAAVMKMDGLYIVDPDLKRREDHISQDIVRRKEKHGSY